ncbi:efflux RND transporter periplasmic adaptor subunit [Martelella alba]|uniref:Efflux RND transporter periplasmic adaptor subunit n=1 Tax=Martelella alba TaxID=2590451 RepID=A0A506U815_9HYPH|nr:efflux RND transporter periplasmic adaptor subunit [Martelella alba]TPW28017.1 efflux RND transporter periplasmic adaptor subunit [Martelella alba]
MRIYTQVLASLAILAVAAVAWLFLAPGGRDVLVRLGIGSGAVETASKAPGAGGPGGGGSGGRQKTRVVAEPVTTGVVNDVLEAIGDGEAVQTVTVLPQVAGTITDVLISSGDMVDKGQVIARLDNREETVARDQAKVALEAAARQSQINQKIKSSISELSLYTSQIAEQTAELQLQSAELALAKRDIVAPFAGIAGILQINAGDYVTTASPIVTIDDRSTILVDFSVPERFAAAIQSGQAIEARPVATPNKLFKGEVEAVDNRIDEDSRTFTVRAKIDNADDALRAGMSFNVTMHFAGDTYPAVDSLAVQWDSQGSYVWQLVDGKAQKARVSIIRRNPDLILVDGDLKPGDQVITEGLQRLREGAEVDVVNQDGSKAGEQVSSRNAA